eukprot:6192388-Heterocapsa_arctica.AAC.1
MTSAHSVAQGKTPIMVAKQWSIIPPQQYRSTTARARSGQHKPLSVTTSKTTSTAPQAGG